MGLDVQRWDTGALAATWAAANPFPHVVIDGAVGGDVLQDLRRGLAQEPHWAERSELVDGMASATTFTQPVLQAFAAALATAPTLDAVRAITGKVVTQTEVRSYVYLPGGYLLPHTDHRSDVGRRVAFAVYLHDAGTCGGGELELFRCTLDGTEIVATEPALRIEPRPARLVLFDVSPGSLHQICEITEGARVAMAGWFL